MRLRVDMTACEGRGLCAELLPEVIALDDWGFPIIMGDIPAYLTAEADEAVRLCPRLALRLEKGPSRTGIAPSADRRRDMVPANQDAGCRIPHRP